MLRTNEVPEPGTTHLNFHLSRNTEFIKEHPLCISRLTPLAEFSDWFLSNVFLQVASATQGMLSENVTLDSLQLQLSFMARFRGK